MKSLGDCVCEYGDFIGDLASSGEGAGLIEESLNFLSWDASLDCGEIMSFGGLASGNGESPWKGMPM